MLLSLGNLAARGQYINASNTFRELFLYGAVPVVNENDTVAVEELRIGDNDTLSAQVHPCSPCRPQGRITGAPVGNYSRHGACMPGANAPVSCISSFTRLLSWASRCWRVAMCQVATLVRADWLFLLTDVPCLYTANPSTDPSAQPIHEVRDIAALQASALAPSRRPFMC